MANSYEKLHSFIIPAYKDCPFIEECIQSLKKQTIKSQIIITTSTPSDFLNKVSKKYQIPLIVNYNSSGIGSDWSFAYRAAKTKYVTLAHQDDIYLPKFLETCLSVAEQKKNSNSLIISSDYTEMSNDKIKKRDLSRIVKYLLLSAFYFKQDIHSKIIKRMIIAFGMPIPCATVMYNKESLGEFKFSNNYQCNLDWEAWLRLSKEKGSFIYINKKLSIQRTHKDSQTWRQIKNKVRQKEDKEMFKQLWPKPIANFLSTAYSLSSKFYRP